MASTTGSAVCGRYSMAAVTLTNAQDEAASDEEH
jgi:hypothetical protein